MNPIDVRHAKGNSKINFTILIPSWNNLELLQNCLESLHSNSALSHQIIIIVNEGADGTLAWVQNQQNLDYIYHPNNVGICIGLNSATPYIDADLILYMNDDMYALPGWDKVLMDEVEKIGHGSFMISSTMIEPLNTGNACVVVKDYGSKVAEFQKKSLLQEFKTLSRSDWNGATWPPNLIHKKMWLAVGGLSEEFSPGMYSDPDLSMKLYQHGVRHFIGKGNSLVYHFGSKSTHRLRSNNGRKIFLMKWGMTARSFFKYVLAIGAEPFILPNRYTIPIGVRMNNILKSMYYRIF